MFGRRHPVRVDRLDVARIGLTVPAGHESLCDRGAFVDHPLRHGGLGDAAGGLRDIGQRHHRCARQLLTGGLVVDVQERSVAPDRGLHCQAGLHVDPDVAGVDRQRERFRRLQTLAEPAVHQQCPDIPESDPVTDQILDIDAAVPQGTAVAVRFGDLGGEGDDALEARDEVIR